MRLSEIKGTYGAIYSLGDLCVPAIQLEKNNLRPFAGPLDWMASPNLSDVNRLLANRFAGFMDYNNLLVQEKVSEKLYLVKETAYNVFSNHDFFTHNNFPPDLHAYPEVKAKYDRRVERFLDKVARSKKILFIRTGGTYEQVMELESILSGLVANDFRLLFIDHAPVGGLIENHWPLQRVCALQIPDAEIWKGNDAIWTEILKGIQVAED